ncbi:MAG TPA: DUF3592 domain-containing protein [Kofleriaceae bacterium]|nr:DUF3592 domain-containing protein [Kofleriaceae bacterium]
MSGAPFRPLYRARHLSEPPRRLPYSLRARLRTGGALGIIGWAFLAIGSLAVWTFVVNSELITLMTFHGEKKTAMGVVIDVSSTSVSENERPVMKVTAEFSDAAGRRRRAQSYTTQTNPPENVTVEYLSGDPDAARIEGMRMRSAPAWSSSR